MCCYSVPSHQKGGSCVQPIRFFVGLVLSLAVAQPILAGETLIVVDRADHETALPRNPNQGALGDLFVFNNTVYDAANRTQVGQDQGYCIRVIEGQSNRCTWTFILRDGQINAEGPFSDKGDSVMIITGGSGKYSGARGSVKVHPRDERNATFELQYELLP